jgi:hypothetical protein
LKRRDLFLQLGKIDTRGCQAKDDSGDEADSNQHGFRNKF